MNQDKYVFAQLTAFLNRTWFNNFVRKHDGSRATPSHLLLRWRGWCEFTFLTKATHISALNIAHFDKKIWLFELFFKWLKQSLKIKRSWDTTKNVVRIQICVATITYCLSAIVQHDMQIEALNLWIIAGSKHLSNGQNEPTHPVR